MIDKRTIFEIHRLCDQGLTERQIARRLHLARPTIRKYLQDPDVTRIKRSPNPGKLTPYYEYIQELLDKWPEASAVVIKQRIEDKGYAGGITILRDYLKATRGSQKQPKAFIRFESPPGAQGQFDWGHFDSLAYGNTRRMLYCMTVLECHSRMLYLEFTHSRTQSAVMRTVLNAFRFFGGTPRELVHDNLTTSVIERVGSIIRFTEGYLHFLRPFHITPYACGLGDASAKGKIEKGGVHYVRYNFWPCRTFTDLDDVNAQATRWRDQVANARIHNTTGEVPRQRFRPDALRPLPDVLPDTRDSAEAKVHSDCRFKFDGNQYSAPHWIVGKKLSIKADNHTVWASYKNKILAQHHRTWERKAVIENPNHVKELLKTRKKARLTQQQNLVLSMGEPVTDFLEGLAQAGKSLNRAIDRLLELREQYGTPAVIAALQLAMKYKAFGTEYVENILHQTTTPRSPYPKVVLQNPRLNQLQLQEPDLLLYDAITLKKRRQNHDDPPDHDG
jgi:transposase